MKKKLLLLIVPVLCFCVVLLAGCNGSQNNTESKKEVSSVQSVAASSSEANTASVNNLTGKNDLTIEAQGKRPVAVMINNITDSLPQYGISDADIMYETLVEGGITRMMAIYGDYTKIPNVCSVRSCRYYYPKVAMGFDAVYLHSGIDQVVAAPMIAEMGIDHFDSDETIFQRDQDRINQGYAIEHTMSLLGSKVPGYLKETNTRTDLSSDKKGTAFSFNKEGSPVTPGGGANKCDKVTLNFSNEYFSTFTYDSANKVYLKQHNGNPHMDQTTGKQLAYTNVIVLETDIHLREDSDKLMDVDTSGSSVGTGYYISDGAYQQIKWSKSSDSDYIKLTDTNGKELSINAGKSYIAMIKPECTSFAE